MLNQDQYKLTWSFNPLLYWLRIFAVDLDVLQERSAFRRGTFNLLGLSILVYTVLWPIGSRPEWFNRSSNSSSTSNNAIPIDKIRSSVLDGILKPTQVCLFQLLLFKWNKIWRKIDDMERKINYSVDSYRRLRKRAVILILVFVFLVPFHLRCPVTFTWNMNWVFITGTTRCGAGTWPFAPTIGKDIERKEVKTWNLHHQPVHRLRGHFIRLVVSAGVDEHPNHHQKRARLRSRTLEHHSDLTVEAKLLQHPSLRSRNQWMLRSNAALFHVVYVRLLHFRTLRYRQRLEHCCWHVRVPATVGTAPKRDLFMHDHIQLQAVRRWCNHWFEFTDWSTLSFRFCLPGFRFGSFADFRSIWRRTSSVSSKKKKNFLNWDNVANDWLSFQFAAGEPLHRRHSTQSTEDITDGHLRHRYPNISHGN